MLAAGALGRRGAGRLALAPVRGEGRGVSDQYGVRDAACPLSTRGGVGGGCWAPGPSTAYVQSSALATALLPLRPPGHAALPHL